MALVGVGEDLLEKLQPFGGVVEREGFAELRQQVLNQGAQRRPGSRWDGICQGGGLRGVMGKRFDLWREDSSLNSFC